MTAKSEEDITHIVIYEISKVLESDDISYVINEILWRGQLLYLKRFPEDTFKPYFKEIKFEVK